MNSSPKPALATAGGTGGAGGAGTIKDNVTGGRSASAQFGDHFGKMGIYVEHPGIKVNWQVYAEHGTERLQKRGMTREQVDRIVENGKALSQNNGQKFAFVTKEGVAVVGIDGKLITAWSRENFDEKMLEIVEKLFEE